LDRLLQLVKEFGDYRPNAKRKAFAAYISLSAQFNAELDAMKTVPGSPVGDQIRAKLPDMFNRLKPLREKVEKASGMLDWNEDKRFRSDRIRWVKRLDEYMPGGNWP
jgi:hypothetical protein